MCHSICSGGIDIAELCDTAPLNVVEIAIFGRPVVIEKDNDVIDDITQLFDKKNLRILQWENLNVVITCFSLLYLKYKTVPDYSPIKGTSSGL
jgi:hypothetical protein